MMGILKPVVYPGEDNGHKTLLLLLYGIFNVTVTNTVSLQLNGVDERLESLSLPMGFANLWTMSFWIKPTQFLPEPVTSNNRVLAHLKGATRRGEVLIWGAKIEGAVLEEEIYVELSDSAGRRMRVVRFNSAQKRSEWRQFSCVWNGTSLIAYNQGLLITDMSVIQSGGNGTMDDPTGGRILRVGDLIEDTGPSLAGWSGTIGHISIWDSALGPAEYGPLISGGFGFDLLTNSGTYTSSANLVHWWKPGDDFPNVGIDYAGDITLTSGTNATATGINNVVTDFPV
jgi:hypothetical protein